MKRIILIMLLVGMAGSIYGQISGHLQTYVGGTTQLTDNRATHFGTWTSLDTNVASVGSQSGLVTGVAQGATQVVLRDFGVADTASIYVSTTDSSGYYFEYMLTNIGQLQQRDCDGVSLISAWSGGMYQNSSGNRAYSSLSTVIYSAYRDAYQIIFSGVQMNSGQNIIVNIPYSKIRDFGGAVPLVGRDSVLSQIQTFGF